MNLQQDIVVNKVEFSAKLAEAKLALLKKFSQESLAISKKSTEDYKTLLLDCPDLPVPWKCYTHYITKFGKYFPKIEIKKPIKHVIRFWLPDDYELVYQENKEYNQQRIEWINENLEKVKGWEQNILKDKYQKNVEFIQKFVFLLEVSEEPLYINSQDLLKVYGFLK